jgi:alpha-D-xyloside xylohydrolase
LCRTGRWGDQVHGMIIWPGDLDASFARQGDPLPGSNLRAVGGLPAALTKGIGLSASGFPFYASDTGGYRHTPANRETWLRWVEANAVWPAMEGGDANGQPWEFTSENGRDQAALNDYARYASLHLRLYPYVWSYATSSRPIVRPIGLAYPALGEHPSDEYLLGDFVLAAPIIAAGQTSRSVLLPPGTWLGWWDGQPHTGRVTVGADLDTLPLFVARGGIVPMLRPSIETLAPVTGSTIDSFATDPGVLWVRVAPGGSPTNFMVYDGTIVGQHVGELTYTPGTAFVKGAMFEVIAIQMPAMVSTQAATLAPRASRAALEAAADGWFWEPATGGTLWIKVNGAATIAIE